MVKWKQIRQRRKSSTLSDSTKRKVTYKYYLLKGSDRVNVCKKMFINTFGLGERTVRSWLEKLSIGNYTDVNQDNSEYSFVVPDMTSTYNKSNKRSRASGNVKSLSVEEFLQSLPKMESHYCRASSQKLYLENVWESKAALFKEYKDNLCVNN